MVQLLMRTGSEDRCHWSLEHSPWQGEKKKKKLFEEPFGFVIGQEREVVPYWFTAVERWVWRRH